MKEFINSLEVKVIKLVDLMILKLLASHVLMLLLYYLFQHAGILFGSCKMEKHFVLVPTTMEKSYQRCQKKTSKKTPKLNLKTKTVNHENSSLLFVVTITLFSKYQGKLAAILPNLFILVQWKTQFF
ncbi:hypothetical protein M9Y10_027833 [Tritrichomonas musculus]|uniref:Uncharacterized protein n=1 Tax=Tritrichomonas musculus TaxID=1915356 RepID=A0ABR2H587_9EUKA